MKSSHSVVINGLTVTVWLDIKGQELAERLGKKAAKNCNGKASLAFGLVKVSMSTMDLQRLTAENVRS